MRKIDLADCRFARHACIQHPGFDQVLLRIPSKATRDVQDFQGLEAQEHIARFQFASVAGMLKAMGLLSLSMEVLAAGRSLSGDTEAG